jgi:ABC-2 type transport system ATP-binding protein
MLEIKDLSKRYGDVVALDGAVVQRPPGRIVGFLGPNGAGKTTTMRCIFGLRRPTGRDALARPADHRETRSASATCPSSAASTRGCGSASSSATSPSTTGCPARDANAATTRWLERLGLGDRQKDKLEALSHGNQQRVQLGAALVHDPELLVLDEPFSGLDPIGIATMTEILRERAAAGVGVVFSSHQLDLVEDVCEDVVIIARGRIVAPARSTTCGRRRAGATSRSRSRAPARLARRP